MTEHLFTLLEMPLPMVYAVHRVLRDCNEPFAQLFGYAREELAGSGFQNLYPQFGDFVSTGRRWQNNLAGVQTYHDERIMQTRDGENFWCSVHGQSRVSGDPLAQTVYCFQRLRRPVQVSGVQLTPRQLQVLSLVASGRTNQEIARELSLSARTVESHRERIIGKLGVSNSAEMVAWFTG